MTGALRGKRIVNTRAMHQAAGLDQLLEERGAIPLAYPCIAIAPPADCTPLDQALRDLAEGRFNWLLLTSGNTVQAVADRLALLEQTVPESVPIAVVGPATAAAVQEAFGRTPQFVPDRHEAVTLAAGLPVRPGERVLAPGSDIARPELAQALAGRGVEVTSVVAYRTVTGSGGVDLPGMLRDGSVDAVTFASSSAVEGFFRRLASAGGGDALLLGVPVVCIGDSTRQTAEGLGLVAHASPTQTIEGMVKTLERLFAPVGSGGTVWS